MSIIDRIAHWVDWPPPVKIAYLVLAAATLTTIYMWRADSRSEDTAAAGEGSGE